MLTNNKNVKVKIMLDLCSGLFLVLRNTKKKNTFGRRYKQIPTRNIDTAVLNKAESATDPKIVISSTDQFVTHYTPSLEQQALLSNQNHVKHPRSSEASKDLFL